MYIAGVGGSFEHFSIDFIDLDSQTCQGVLAAPRGLAASRFLELFRVEGPPQARAERVGHLTQGLITTRLGCSAQLSPRKRLARPIQAL